MAADLISMLEETAKRYGEKAAFVFGKRRLSFAELDETSNKLANALIGRGIRQGDRIGMLVHNSPDFMVIYFGILKAGGIAVPLDIRYKISELTSVLNSCQPRALIGESSFLEPFVSAIHQFSYIEYVIDMDSHYKQFIGYAEFIATSAAHRTKVKPQPDDIAHVAYASGPAFNPTGAISIHRTLLTEIDIVAESFQQSDKDVVMLFALPMYHAMGLVIVALTSIAKGSTVVILPGLSMRSLCETVERERCSIFMAVPYVLILMVNMAQEEGIHNDLSSLRICISGGAPLSDDLIRRFKKVYGLDIHNLWGMTESTAQPTFPTLNSSGKPGSTGIILPGWKLKIIDDDDRELPTNQNGEIIVSGPIMKGYYNNPEATARAIKDGWLYTGDIGRIDEDGYLFITGRKKEMIIVKGKNIYPSDIEQMLYTHPKVAEAAVVGIPDELRGEVIRAVISLKKGETATEQEIKQFCLENLASFKVPRQVIFMDALPKTDDGRIKKEALKD